MARTSQSRQTRGSSASKGRTSQKRNISSKRVDDSGFLDYETKRSILGVFIIVLGVALFLAVVIRSDAVVTSAVSNALRLTFGTGAYIFPFFMAAIGISFLVRSEQEHLSGRVALGLLIIFIALLGIFGLLTSGVSQNNLNDLFTATHLRAYGGYVGAGIAWVGLSLLGQVISLVILAGCVIAALFVIGFSLHSFSEAIEQKREAFRERRRQLDSVAAAPYLDERTKRPSADNKTMPIVPGKKIGELGASSQAKPSAKTKQLDVMREEDLENVRSLKTKLLKTNKTPDGARKSLKLGASVAEDSGALAAGALGAGVGAVAAGAVVGAAKRGTRSSAKTEALPNAMAPVESYEPEKPLTRKLGTKPADTKDAVKPKAQKGRKNKGVDLSIPAPQEGFELPSMRILQRSKTTTASDASEEELAETAQLLQETLEDFGCAISVAGWVAGPTVTLFKISLPSGMRVSKITALNDDIALALAAPGVRIFAPIPGTNYVGIEVPNKRRQNVLLGDVLDSAPAGPLQCAVGKDVEGKNVVIDLAKAPHLLIGGTTGSGKSVGINSFIMSMLMRNTPSEVRLILIDPKRVEFTLYNGIPHLYIPVVEDPKDASAALNWGVAEMERRLKVFSKAGARNIGQFNTKVQSGELEDEAPMPYIVIVIDELADLMMNVGKDVEFSISRIAQLARAAGIHLIVATQRPSANVVTGLIKSNITTRMAFTVASALDSRVILDTNGAESLTNYGDMLLSKPDLAKPLRIQGCFVSEDEINEVVEHLKQQGEPEYHSEILQVNTFSLGDTAPDGSGGKCQSDDPLLWEAADIVVSAGTASTSYLQRRLSVGYSRAGRIMDALEEKGIVGPNVGSKARDVLVDALELETLKAFEIND